MSHVLCVKEGWPTCRRHKGNVVSIIPGKIRREGSSFPLRETVAVLLLYVGHLWLFGYSPALAQLSPLPRAVHLSSVSPPFPIVTFVQYSIPDSKIQKKKSSWLIQALLCTACIYRILNWDLELMMLQLKFRQRNLAYDWHLTHTEEIVSFIELRQKKTRTWWRWSLGVFVPA